MATGHPRPDSWRHPRAQADAGDAVVETVLQGLTSDDSLDPDHAVAIVLNCTAIGTMTFDGYAHASGRFTVSSSLLREGDIRQRNWRLLPEVRTGSMFTAAKTVVLASGDIGRDGG